MASYYFRNTGSKAWNVGTNWSLTDGGGATGSIPTTTDNAYFSDLSGDCDLNVLSFTLNLDFTKGNGYNKSFTVLSGADMRIQPGGSITLSSNMTLTSPLNSTGLININNCTLNFNGNTFNANLLIGVAANITLQSDLQLKSLKSQTNNATVTFSGSYNIIADEFINLSYGHTTNLSGNLTINNNFNVVQATAANKNTIKSTVNGTKRSLIVKNTAIIDLGFVNFTDIDATNGQTIFTYKGTVSNCTNVQPLTESLTNVSTGVIV